MDQNNSQLTMESILESEDSSLKKLRISKYELLEKEIGCPLIVYITSTRPNIPGSINPLIERPFIDIIQTIPQEEKNIAIFLYSTGGDANTAWKLISLLRERFDKITVIVPYMAYSAATMFALGADEIIMHPYANLGPIDPQITMRTSEGKKQFAYEDLCAFFRFLKTEANINGEEQITRLMEKMFTRLEPQGVGFAHRASEMAGTIGERMLKMHMDDQYKAKQIASNLNRSFFNHGDAVSRALAKKMGLSIKEIDSDFENLIWETFLVLESFMKLREDFNPRLKLLKDPDVAKTLAPKPDLQLPPSDSIEPNIKELLVNKLVETIMKQQSQKNYVPYSFIMEMVESKEHSELHMEEGNIYGTNTPQGLSIEVMPTFSGWKKF